VGVQRGGLTSFLSTTVWSRYCRLRAISTQYISSENSNITGEGIVCDGRAGTKSRNGRSVCRGGIVVETDVRH